MAFLRFACRRVDLRTGQPLGLMTLAYEVLRSDGLIDAEADELRGYLDWFEHHLPIPSRFSRTRNVSHKETHGIAWLKPGADAAISRAYAIAEILERHGHDIDVMRTQRPGYVVYEDEMQVVAEPFHGEKR